MAFSPIDPTQIEAGDPVTQELFDTVRLNFDDHETRIGDLETSSAVSLLVGEIRMYGGASAPTGWIICDGQAISRTTFSDLFAVIGETYGAGDGSTTFNVPDHRSRGPVGDNAAGGGGLTTRVVGDEFGNETHTHTLPSHSHTTPSHNHQWYVAKVGTDDTFNSGGTQIGITTGGVLGGVNIQAGDGAGTNYNTNSHTNNKNPTTNSTGLTNSTNAHLDPSITHNFIIKT